MFFTLRTGTKDDGDKENCFLCGEKAFYGALIHKGYTPYQTANKPSFFSCVFVCSECLGRCGEMAAYVYASADFDLGPGHENDDKQAISKITMGFWKGLATARAEILYMQDGELNKVHERRRTAEDQFAQLENALNSEAARTEGEGWVYLMRRPDGCHKIGLSGNVKRRIEQLRRSFPLIALVHRIRVDDMRQAEAILHDEFALYRKDGEWFALSPENVELIRRRVRFEDGWFLQRAGNVPMESNDEAEL